MATNSDIQASLFVYVSDSVTGKITRIAVPTDMQVGLLDKPAELQLLGRLSLNVTTFDIRGESTTYIGTHDTISLINVISAPVSGTVSVKLPDNPRRGQLYVIKDASGTTNVTPVAISSIVSGVTINGSSTLTLSDVGSSAVLFWTGSEWSILISGGSVISGGSSGGDSGASYVVISATGSLTNERQLAVAIGELTMSDGGANSAVTLGLDNTGISAAIYQYAFFTVDAKGRITSASIQPVPAPVTGAYLLATANATLTQARTVTNGTGIFGSDGGPGGSFNFSINNNVVATVSGTRFTGPVSTTGGLTGTLHNLISGISYLAAGAHITIISQSSGQLRISGENQGDRNATYVVVSTTASIPNERVLAAGNGLRLTDSGAGGNITFSINDNIVATVSGTRFTGPVSASAGLSGSLQQISTGLPYLVAGPNVSITTQSNGQITIQAGTDGGLGDPDASYLVLGTTASLNNERAFTPGTGLKATDAGANSSYTLMINDNVVATVSGTRFTGGVTFVSTALFQNPVTVSSTTVSLTNSLLTVGSGALFQGGITGTLHRLASGLSYLAAGDNISIVSQSNGQIRITADGSGADSGATYVVMSTTASLPNERALTAGTGIRLTDGGAGGAATLAINNNVVATVSGTRFTGPVVADGGLTGSLQNVAVNLPYLLAGPNINITTQSNGQIIIGAGTDGGFGDPDASYLVLASTASLNSERVLTPGTGIRLTDAGANSSATLAINDSIVATISGARFSGPVVIDSTTTLNSSLTVNNSPAIFNAGLSGSHTKLANGTSLIVAGTFISVTTQSNGQIRIDDTAPAFDAGASFIVIGTTSSLTNERQLAGVVGQTYLTDTGANGSISINLSTTGVTTGSFTYPTLTVDPRGRITSIANGITPAPQTASYIVVGTDPGLTNERTLDTGLGLISTDAGPNASFTIAVNNNVVATISGSTFTGPVSASAGLSGSLQQIAPGLPYLIGDGDVTITTQSNGQVVIASYGGGGGSGDAFATYVVLALTSTLANERVLTPGTGLILNDAGPNAAVTLSVSDNFVAFISGSTFTGPLSASNGLSGSLQNIGPNLSYLVAGNAIDILTQSNGQIRISAQIDTSASYIVMSTTSSLSNERALAQGVGIRIVDGGPNSNVTFSVDDGIVATLSGSIFSGRLIASGGLSGSLQNLSNGSSYLVQGDNVTIVSQSNGQIRISSQVTDVSASYVVISTTGSLPNERALAQGPGVRIIDGGAGAGVTFSINDNIVATVSGTQFTGPVSASAGLSGSLQMIGPNLAYLVEGSHITIVSQSNGQIRISSQMMDVSASYVVISTTGSLPNERALTQGTGIKIIDGGAGSGVTFSIDDNFVAMISGSTFTGPLIASGGLSGSLQSLSNGLSYLVAGDFVTIVSQSNGQIRISSTAAGGGGSDVSASYVVMSTTGSLPNERALSAGTGIFINDNGPGNTVSFSINDGIVATLSGSIFSGRLIASGGLSGSLQNISDGTSFLLAGDFITIVTQSNGQIRISSTAAGGSGSDVSASYVVMSTTGSLPNERALAQGVGVRIIDGGIGSNVTFSVDDGIVATLSGSIFSGRLIASGGLSGSLQNLSNGSSYLVQGDNISIVSQSNGQIRISAIAGTTYDYFPLGIDEVTTITNTEIVLGGLYFDPSVLDINVINARLAGDFSTTDGGATGQVRLYDMGPGSGSFTPVLRSTVSIPFSDVGLRVKKDQVLVLTSSPGVNINEIHNVGRVYEARMYLNSINPGSLAISWTGFEIQSI